MVATVDGTTGAEFLSWIRRQMVITKVYRPTLWRAGLLAHVIYCSAMAAAALHAPGALIPQFLLAYVKGRNRAVIARRCLAEHEAWFARWSWIYSWGVVLGTWIWMYSFAASAFASTIVWRGRTYVLRYPGKPPASL
jgi:hypothetical protein